MTQLFLTFLLAMWLVCASVMWLVTVHDTATAIQFSFLNLPPTAVLLFLIVFDRRPGTHSQND